MTRNDFPDLNLLFALQVLLEEEHVGRASRRLGLSPSATSRTLARLRDVTGDPLLVRAGRNLVSTPRARGLKERLPSLMDSLRGVLEPSEQLAPASMRGDYVIRSSEGFAETFGPSLIARLAAHAPGLKLTFAQKFAKRSDGLRDGGVHLETAVVTDEIDPEIRSRRLFDDRFVMFVREGHALAHGAISIQRLQGSGLIWIKREGLDMSPLERACASHGFEPDIATTVGGFSAAVLLASRSDMVAIVPEVFTGCVRQAGVTRSLPFASPEFTISLLWHPRHDADQTIFWLRNQVHDICAKIAADVRGQSGLSETR